MAPTGMVCGAEDWARALRVRMWMIKTIGMQQKNILVFIGPLLPPQVFELF
jgi:hypothetical protein